MLCLENGSACQFVVCGVSILTRRLENAGHSFFLSYESPQFRETTQSESPPDDKEIYDERWKEKKKLGGNLISSRLRKSLNGPNLYDVLEVKDYATMDEIKKSFRQLALTCHPDKTTVGNDSPSYERFINIHEAFDILSDPLLRKQYDSALPFDDSVPTPNDLIAAGIRNKTYANKTANEKEAEESAFFRIFDPIFKRYSKWSKKKPVAELGDINTSFEETEKFYSFWMNFQSWRDFSIHDEYDLEDADSREERRWMEKQNSRIQKVHIRNEKRKISGFVDLAYENDPRILREKENKARRKKDMQELKRKELEARRLKQDAARLERMKEEEKLDQQRFDQLDHLEQEKAIQKQRNKELKKWKTLFKKIYEGVTCSDGHPSEFDLADLDQFLDSLSYDEFQNMLQTIKRITNCAIDDDYVSHSRTVMDFLKDKICEDRMRRYVKILPKNNPSREVKHDDHDSLNSSWTKHELNQLAKGIQKYSGGVCGRWEKIAEMVGTKTVEEVLKKSKEINSQKPKAQIATQNNDCFTKIEEKENNKPQTEETWTQQQQQALESALVKYPSSMPPKQRWSAIAGKVPYKTAKQCLIRFKEIRSLVLQNRSI